jgi:hypothetical protein
MMRNARIFPHSMDFKGAGLGGDGVDMHETVATLRGNEFIERVPCNTLNVMIMLGNL